MKPKFKDFVKLGAGFYIGYTLAQCIDQSLGQYIKPIIERLKEKM